MQKKYLFVLPFLFFSVVFASSSKVKEYKTYSDFKDGKFHAVTLSAKDGLTLAPQVLKICDTNSQHVWHVSVAGKNIYVAAGSPVKIIEIRNGDSLTVYSGEEPAIFAMAAAKNNAIYFAPAPGGLLYRLQNGKTEKIAELDVQYIWDILPFKDDLLIATGDPGLILRLNSQAQIDTVFSSAESHIRVLASDAKGQIYAGSADHGLVYRFDQNFKPFVLYDSPETEIFAIIPLEKGEIWAAGLSEKLQRPVIAAVSNGGKSNGDGTSDKKTANDIAAAIIANGGSNKGAVYKIGSNGVARNYWQSSSERVQAIQNYGDGSLLVGTGDNGKVFRIAENGDIVQLLDFDAAQIVAVENTAAGTLLATANSGLVYEFSKNKSKIGRFESAPFDAGSFTKWGSLSWTGSGKIIFSARSGNTEKPDKTWSPWFKMSSREQPSSIEAPVARYIQWQAELMDSAILKTVAFGYRQQNIAPLVKDIVIHEPGVAYLDAVKDGQKDGAQSSPVSDGKKTTEAGFQSIGWTMVDDNSDQLQCSLWYQFVGTRSWRLLVEDYSAAVYSWDTRTMEDGNYLIKISASDRSANLQNELTDSKISEPVLIDNSGPGVSQLAKNGSNVVFNAQDKFSRIGAAFFAVNSGQWQEIAPADGIADSQSEQFQIDVSNLEKGTHTIMIKVEDERKNTTFKHLNFIL
ncbi:MAG: hypothetical protein DWQ05_08140 [Calditrichaeota bacterium]|nr:MAG: hypothetical protein DWQ05_08140 [Calditrichota bacterium]